MTPAAGYGLLIVVAVGGCAVLARRYPLIATLLACPLTFSSWWLSGTAQTVCQTVLPLVLFPLVYRLATTSTAFRAVAATALLALCWQAGGLWHSGADGFNPPIYFGTVGPCAVGLVVRSRDRSRARLAAQSHALALAREEYVAVSVRYERTRIARELHDVVAHSVSAMVVQAHAGHKLASVDPTRAAQAFDHIAGSARQAASEIERLVWLLEPAAAPKSHSIDELVARARAIGLNLDYRVAGEVDVLDPERAATAYAVIQEALTNALKHAPGAPITVEMSATSAVCVVVVTNGAARARSLGLAQSGGGHGLPGMRARLAACAGTLVVAPTSGGGWRVAAQLPLAR